jgi:bifunctional UDP-N-acetylglucosamine pyrophosphorylase / glucosamine-1-phosphate N-acetyltransferase
MARPYEFNGRHSGRPYWVRSAARGPPVPGRLYNHGAMQAKLAVVVLAAGRSTRFKSRTTKLLHELCGKPMLEWVLDAVLPLDPAQIIVVNGVHSAALTQRYAEGHAGHEITFALQEPPLGTGHALLQARPLINEGVTHLLVLAGDVPRITTAELTALREAHGASGAEHAVLTAELNDPSGYGRVLRSTAAPDHVERIVEQLDATPDEQQITEINSGIYIFSHNVFEQLEVAARELGTANRKGEYYLPDAVSYAQTIAVPAQVPPDVLGVNDRLQLAQAEAALQARLRHHWMQEGVTFRLPETVYLHHDVQLSPDVEVGPHCVLTLGTRIGSGTVLIQGCYLEACEIGRDCTLLHVRGTEAVLHDGVRAGPYVNLRPGTILRENVKVGNFVETKKADVGRGSKLPHLQYIGDATLGENVNIGAGTIFCNYDGFAKHHTTLGDNVFIGSNSSLSAPLTIGDGAYVAMASAITKDVPAGALAVARARQENKLDYVKQLKERLQQRLEQEAQAKAAAAQDTAPDSAPADTAGAKGGTHGS